MSSQQRYARAREGLPYLAESFVPLITQRFQLSLSSVSVDALRTFIRMPGHL